MRLMVTGVMAAISAGERSGWEPGDPPDVDWTTTIITTTQFAINTTANEYR